MFVFVKQAVFIRVTDLPFLVLISIVVVIYVIGSSLFLLDIRSQPDMD